jgi:hypothetical protein
MVFNQITSMVDVSDDNKNRKGGVNSTLSMLVGSDGRFSNQFLIDFEQIRAFLNLK